MSTIEPEPPSCVRFYREECGDHRGRKLSGILAESKDWLEYTHDYIQWLFPLPEPSAFNRHAPLLSLPDIRDFTSDKELQHKLIKSLTIMLDFYGLSMVNGGGVEIINVSSYQDQRKRWLSPGNHNFLRLTRILRSLCLLGCRRHAQALLSCLTVVYRDNQWLIGAETFEFWRRAVN